MADNFNEYRDDFEKDYFNSSFSGFLLTPHTTLYNSKKLKWDLLNNTRNLWIDNVWKALDIHFIMTNYMEWILSDSDRKTDYENGDYKHDEKYKYYRQVLIVCSLYGITPIHAIGWLSILQMLRLLLFKLKHKYFDGSREQLLKVFESLNFGDGLQFGVITKTDDTPGNASATYYLFSSYTTSVFKDVAFNETDRDLFYGGYYNLIVLGIKYNYVITQNDGLIYDVNDYDDNKKYDKGYN